MFRIGRTVTNCNAQVSRGQLFPLRLRQCTSQRIAATATWANTAVPVSVLRGYDTAGVVSTPCAEIA